MTAKTQRQMVNEVLTGKEARGKFAEAMGHQLAELMLDVGLGTSCLNCDNWNTDGSYGSPTNYNKKFPEGCMRFKLLPPPKIIAVGCDKHTDQIPF